MSGRSYQDCESEIFKELVRRTKASRPQLGRKMHRLIQNLDHLTVQDAEALAGLKGDEKQFLAALLMEILTDVMVPA